MNKAALISAVAEKHGMTKKETEKIVDLVLDTITETLATGEKVQLVGFGTFEVRERAARTGHNPITREPIEIPKSKGAAFKAGRILKAAVETGEVE